MEGGVVVVQQASPPGNKALSTGAHRREGRPKPGTDVGASFNLQSVKSG